MVARKKKAKSAKRTSRKKKEECYLILDGEIRFETRRGGEIVDSVAIDGEMVLRVLELLIEQETLNRLDRLAAKGD